MLGMFESDSVEPRFEEGNGFKNLLGHPAGRNARYTKLSTWMGWDNSDIRLWVEITSTTEGPGKVDGGDGKIIETWEVTDVHREGCWMDNDLPQCQTCHVFEGRAIGMKHRRYLVGGHAPFPNHQRPKGRKGLEMEDDIGEG